MSIFVSLGGDVIVYYFIVVYVQGYSNKATYIATQGPLLNTLNDFWRLVWEKEVHVIVMLTQLEEKGQVITRTACIYWCH